MIRNYYLLYTSTVTKSIQVALTRDFSKLRSKYYCNINCLQIVPYKLYQDNTLPFKLKSSIMPLLPAPETRGYL